MSDQSLVVVAHPDDEVIWLAPAASRATTILAALPTVVDDALLTAGRSAVRAEYPLRGFEFLPLSEAGVFHRSDWLRRAPTAYGVTLPSKCPRELARSYVTNFAALLELLDPYVREHPEIFTHNPWGEYGHEEHIQVSMAVMALAHRHGQSVWAWNGLSDRQLLSSGARLRHDFYGQRPLLLPRRQMAVDLSLYRSIKQLYMAHGAWTWHVDYEPPPLSTYIQLMRRGEALLPPNASPPRTRYLGLAPYMMRRAVRAARRRLPRRRDR